MGCFTPLPSPKIWRVENSKEESKIKTKVEKIKYAQQIISKEPASGFRLHYTLYPLMVYDAGEPATISKWP